MPSVQPPLDAESGPDDAIYISTLIAGWRQRWRTVAAATVLAGAAGMGIAFLMTPVFTAVTVIMPPQQQGSASASALSSLGALAGLAGGAVKSPAEQYTALMGSTTVSDRIIDRFGLMKQYSVQFRVDARKILAGNVAISVGKKDGLIAIEVDDPDPRQAAAMANAYVDNLRLMTNNLAVTEAQQRRGFFELKLKETQQHLIEAQVALQSSGINAGALKAQPVEAAAAYARLQTDLTSAQVRLDTMRGSLADTAPAVRQQQSNVEALRAQIERIEKSQGAPADGQGADYIGKLRDFKYQETLYELYARQLEAARADESREGALIQVVDPATPPEKKSKPRRLFVALEAALVGFLLSSLWALSRRPRVASQG